MTENNVKVVMLGNSAVGKTTLVTRWTEDRYDGKSTPTIGAAYKQVTLEMPDGNKYSMHLWDTAGQDEYRSTTSIYCRDAKAAMIVFDITDYQSFQALPNWITTLKDKANVPFIIVGNKADKQDIRQVSFDDAAQMAQQYNVPYYETSALTSFNVDDAFNELANAGISFMNSENSNKETVETTNNQPVDLNKPKETNQKQNSQCC